ncbi:McrB family protein [Pseudonocardia spirodelae]|uniref:AAA family ATPase n=1 Tax=Pseudonocardia spirodelae TaxID=3133431 RepID=A0ABU8T472_9PSEU
MHSSELEFRRRWYEAHARQFAADPAVERESTTRQAGFARSAEEALGHLATLRRTGDVESFRAMMQAWAVKPDTVAFNGFAGQMLLNQLVKRSEDPYRTGSLLAEALTAPDDIDGATAKIRSVVDAIEAVRSGGQPAPRSAAFLLSYFWALADRRWPIHWTSAASFVEFITGVPLPKPVDERYREFTARAQELDTDVDRVERVARWWENSRPTVVDPVLVDRCAFGADADAVDHDDLVRNAAALVAFARYTRDLGADVEKEAGRPLQSAAPARDWKDGRPRADTWVDWTDGRTAPGIRIWINAQGMGIGVKPGLPRSGWYDEAAAVISDQPVPSFGVFGARGSRHGEDAGFVGSAGEFLYGRWFDRDQLTGLDLRAELLSTVERARPVLDALITLAGGEPGTARPTTAPDPLVALAEEFRRWGYPRPADDTDRAARARFADLLADGALPDQDPAELRKIWNTQAYGGPGPMAPLNAALGDPATYDRFLDTVRHLCHGDGEDADRIDAVLTDPQWKIHGLGESVCMKLLAITRPERFLPVFPYKGEHGKHRLLQLLGMPEPAATSRGHVQVDANDRLRRRVEHLFPGDPWGMSRFLLWYVSHEPERTDDDPIADLAEDLLIDRAFLDEIIELLRDKGQVVLYGPPGTGKTYIAKKLAEVLAPDRRRRSIVQFHPSTSYEDFVEGYRPQTVDGAVAYSLTDGPLRTLAGRAKEAPGTRHVMLIDEINRGNLPKILGELLFLLEYRGEQVGTLYRPDEAFELPPDLWFIGTMNTADRSVALIDAALRRRFHFVPIYPDSGPLEGLLQRWLKKHDEPAWVAGLVGMVNGELIDALGGPHLQIGPSHFMRRGLDETVVARIWRYNVEPFVEDQFFGDQARIDRFRWAEAWRRYQDWSGSQGSSNADAEE